jgi:hypothetical protein
MPGAAKTVLSTQYTQMLCLSSSFTDMAQGQHGHLCQDLAHARFALFFPHFTAQLTNLPSTFSTNTNIIKSISKVPFKDANYRVFACHRGSLGAT